MSDTLRWRPGRYGAVVLHEVVSVELWATRGETTTTLFINEPGKPARAFALPNAAADRLADALKGVWHE